MNQKKEVIDVCEKIISFKGNGYDSGLTKLFGQLIFLIKKQDDCKKLYIDDEIIRKYGKRIRKIFSIEQINIENFWANKIINSESESLKSFPFYSGYNDSASFIYHALMSIGGNKIKKILYVGSGALPLNPILISKNYGLCVDMIERDHNSYIASRKIIKKIKFRTRIKIFFDDIANFNKLSSYDAVIVAVLVGEDKIQKKELLHHIIENVKDDCLILTKNVIGARELLYNSLDKNNLKDYNVIADFFNFSELTNELLFFKK